MPASAAAASTAAGLVSQGIQSGLNTGSSLFNTLMQWFANKRNIASTEKINLENRQFAAQMSELEWRRFRQQWQDENAYNSPAAQMQRYIAAGLNPNLIYGQAPSIPSSSPSVPSPNVNSSQVPLMSPISSDLGPQLINKRLLDAQVRNLESNTKLTYEQANRIVTLTPVEFSKIQNESDVIKQTLESREYATLVEKLKAESFKDNSLFNFEDETGQTIVTDLKSLIFDNSVKSLYASNLEYEYALKSFASRVGLIKGQDKYQDNLNKDWEYFLEYAADIYKAQGDEAKLYSVLASGNKEFWEQLGGKSEAVRLIAQFIALFVNGSVRLDAARISSRK